MARPGSSIRDLFPSTAAGSRWAGLDRWQRRVLVTLVALSVLILLSSVVYHGILIVFEKRSPSYPHSLQVVIETYTGTGYGSDSPWRSPVTNAFVSLMDLGTFLLLFIFVPYVFRPVLEAALSPSVPGTTEQADHVIVCGLVHQGERLVEELERRDVAYVVLTDEKETARRLHADGFAVLLGDPTSAESFERARVTDARSVVVDTEDVRSASTVLAVSEVDETVQTVVLVEDLEHERRLRYAGANRVMTPRHLLGRRIAERIASECSPTRTDSVQVGEGLSLLELSIAQDSPITGKTIGEAQTAFESFDRVVGVWTDGTFTGMPAPDTVLDEETVLLVAGEPAELRDLERRTHPDQGAEPRVVVAGFGEVGSTVTRELGARVTCTVVDREAKPDVDVVGDTTEDATLQEAGIEDASIFVVTIADDDEAILSVLAADELAQDLDIIVRVNESGSERMVRRAGADYVLGLQEISGRVLAREVLHEDILSLSRQLKVVRVEAAPFAGGPLAETDLAASDCVVVAVERDGELVTPVPASFELRTSDRLLVVGSDEEIDAILG